MKRLFIAIALVSFALCSYGQEDTIIGNLYRNNTHKFRIKFPIGWQIQNCDGIHMVKKAVDNEASSVTVGVFPFDDTTGIDFDKLTDEEFNEFYTAIKPYLIEGMTKKFSKPKMLEQGIRRLDNKRAFYFKISGSYGSLDRQIKMTLASYYVPFKEKFYTITGGASYELFPQKEELINLSASSFVIEDYAPVSAQDTSFTTLLTNVKFNWPYIIFSIIFTWIIGLILPVILRFVILKRPIRKKLHAVLLTFLFWFINIFFFISIGSKDKTHGALVLIAIASYYILYGFKRNSNVSKSDNKNMSALSSNSIDNKFVKEKITSDKPVKFTCPICNNLVVSSFCKKGDAILCRKCNNNVIIPDNAEYIE